MTTLVISGCLLATSTLTLFAGILLPSVESLTLYEIGKTTTLFA